MISFNGIYFKRCKDSTSFRIFVIDNGVGCQYRLPAGPAPPQAQVDIFAVRKKIVIEKTDFVYHHTTVKRGAGAGEEDIFDVLHVQG